jgi:hypothetical protein
LVGALPPAEAPADLLEHVRVSLERRTLLGQHSPEPYRERQGARHLMVRKVLATAAMIGLVAVLATVVYIIVSPEKGTSKPVAVEGWQRPAKKVVVEKEEAAAPAAVSAKAAVKTVAAAPAGFAGRLELKTGNLTAVDAFIDRAIEDNGISESVRQGIEGDKKIYVLSCSREDLNQVLADLRSIWDKFSSATLFVQKDRVAGEAVVVGAVTAEQISEIINQSNAKRRVEVARDFAVLNRTAELLPGKEILTTIDSKRGDLMTIPKPVLTSSEKTIRKPTSRVIKEEEKVYLTIVVAESK